MIQAHVLESEPACALGESALTLASDPGSIGWVDIDRGDVWRGRFAGAALVDAERVCSRTGAVALLRERVGGGWLLAVNRFIESVDEDLVDGPRRELIDRRVASRLNDGDCDAKGRLVIGTLALDARRGQERLLLVDAQKVTVLDDDLMLSNGIAWSPDGASLYSVDTGTQTVWRRSYDPDTGAAGKRHRFVRFSEETPDGLSVDVDGNLWVAMWGGAQVVCIGPSGVVEEVVTTPVGHPTSTCFVAGGGLVITSAGSPRVEGDGPYAGSLLYAEVGVEGPTRYAWNPQT